MEKKGIKRATNFTAVEETLLVQLVKKYVKEIECCQTDTNTNKIRSDAWRKIGTEFNSKSLENYRDVLVLKNKYGNLKKRSKKNFAEQRKSLYKTGGGKMEPFVETELDNDMRVIIGAQMTGFPSFNDDDFSGMFFN